MNLNSNNELNSSSLLKSTLLILKYKLEHYKLSTDDNGYVLTRDILKLLRSIHTDRKYITAFDLQHIVRADMKKRLEITKDLTKIRLVA